MNKTEPKFRVFWALFLGIYGVHIAPTSRARLWGVFRNIAEILIAPLPELGAAATHNLVLANQLGAEFTAVQREVDVKVHPVEDALWRIHALEVGLEVLAREVRGEGNDLFDACKRLAFHPTHGRRGLTRILSILWADIFVAGIKHILVHEGSAGCYLTEEADLDGLADLDTLALLHEDLAGVLASVTAIQTGHTVLLRVVSLLEWLQGCH